MSRHKRTGESPIDIEISEEVAHFKGLTTPAAKRKSLERLVKLVEPFLGHFTKDFTRSEGDKDEVMQLGRLTVEQTAKDYNGSIPFIAFLRFTFRRRVKTWYRSAEKLGYARDALRNVQCVSQLHHSDSDEDSTIEFVDGDACTPLQSTLHTEQLGVIAQLMTKLSARERRVIELWLGRATYEEIGNELGMPTKAVDNAISRVKQKGKALRARGFFGREVE